MNLLAEISNKNLIAPAVILIVGLVVLCVAVVIGAVYVIGRYHKYASDGTLTIGKSPETGGKFKTWHMLLIILGAGFLIRILFTAFIDGFYAESSNIYNIVQYLVNNGGFSGLYSGSSVDAASTTPLMIYINYVTAGIGYALGLDLNDQWMTFFIKLPYIVADLVMAFALYRIASKHLNRYVGLAFAGIYSLCPVFFTMSSVWGSHYCLYVPIVFFAFYYLLKRNITMTAVFMTLMFSLAPDSIFLAPIFLSYMIYLLVKAIRAIIAEKPNFDSAMSDPCMKNVVDIPVCLIISLSAIYLIALPAYATGGMGVGIHTVFYNLFIQPIARISTFGSNALNVFAAFGQNYGNLGGEFPTLVFWGLIMALILAVVLIIFLNKRNRANLILLGAFVICTVNTYFVGSNEWSMAPALAIMLLAFIAIQDKRILKVFSIYALIMTVNAVLVMLYSNNISSEVISAGNPELTWSNAPVGYVFTILFSIVAVLTHLYFTVVVLDISMTKNRKLFPEDSYKLSLGGMIREWAFGR